jgi:hypothetical protein
MSLRSKARDARAFKRSFDRAVRGVAWVVGWVGMGALALVGLLWLLPVESWSPPLNPAHLHAYTLGAISAASLVGWSFVNQGEDRIRDRVGKHVSLAAFVILPVACTVAGFFPAQVESATGANPPAHPLWLFVRWYPPALIMLSASVFLARKSKPRKYVYARRAVAYILLLAPYALLFAYMTFGPFVDWVDGPMHETLAAAGVFAIALHLAFAYFIDSE